MDSESQALPPSSPASKPAQPAPSAPVIVGLQAWVEVNKKRLLYGGVGVLATVLVVGVFLQFQAGREARASHALSEIRFPIDPRTPAPPGLAEALYKVATSYKGSAAAPRALMMCGSVLYAEQNFAVAQERFNTVLQQYSDSPWVANAHLGVGACLEAQGKADDAIKKYEDVRKRFATAPVANDAKLALGRLYEKSNPEEAFKLYAELMQGNPQSGMAAEAGLRQEELLKAKPELAKLREPVVPQAPPVQVTMLTNKPTVVTNMLSITNRPGGTNQPIQIKLNPSPAPGAAQPPPAVVPAPAPTPDPPAAPAPPK